MHVGVTGAPGNQLQYSTSQLAYNWDCCGVALEFRQVDFGARNENQFRFSFSLKNIGSFGNLKETGAAVLSVEKVRRLLSFSMPPYLTSR